MSEPAIALSGVHKWHGAHHALRNIDLTVAAGEKIVICGPSGSGKSTLLRCINGLERHDEGDIRIAGEPMPGDPAGLRRVRARIGLVFQAFNLFPHLTILENCTLAPQRVKSVPRVEAERLALALLDRVRMADQAAKYPSQLSGGEQQRVAIARALCMEPKIILFDEPTSALDAEMVKDVLDILRSLASEGMTMVCATHEMGFAREVADRIVFMDEGQIMEIGETAAFFGAPRHVRTRTFLSRILY